MALFLHHMKSSLWDFLLLAVLSSAFSMLVSTGFLSGSDLASGVLPVCAALVSLLVLYALSYSKRTALAGIVVVPVLAVVALVVASSLWGGEMFDDVAGNPCPVLLASIVSTVLVFLLSRKRPGVVVMIFLVVLTCGYLQFVYKENHIALVIIVLLCCLALLAFRGFTRQRYQASQKRGGVGVGLGVCVAFGAAIMLVACGIFFAVIAPLNPPVMTPKLLKEYIALPQVEQTGTANDTKVENEDNTSNTLSEQEEYSKGEKDETEQEQDSESPEQNQQDQQSKDDYDSEADDAGYSTVTFELPPVTSLIWVLVVIVAIVVFVILKLWLRRRRMDRLMSLEPEEMAVQAYLFFLVRAKKLGLPRQGGHTPLEYAQSCKLHLEAFDMGEGTNFISLTQAYVAVVYGKAELTQLQQEHVCVFLENFYKNAREHLGTPKYLWLLFRL